MFIQTDNQGSGKKTTFSSISSLSQWLSLLFVVVVIIDVIALISDGMEIQLLNRMASGQVVSEAEGYASDDRQALIGTIYTFLYLVTAISFLVWVHHAHRNLPSFGCKDLKHSPGWAIGGFFIPIGNLWIPYQVVKEIWQASDPNIDIDDGTAWQKSPSSLMIIIWWVLWLFSGVFGVIFLRLFLRMETINDYLTLSYSSLVIDLLDIPAAILALLIVWNIGIRQEKKSQSLYINPTL